MFKYFEHFILICIKHMKPVIKQVYESLRNDGIIRNQAHLADMIGVNKGWLSTLLKQNAVPPVNVQNKLNETFAISLEWLASNGTQGKMFARDGTHKHDQKAGGNQLKSHTGNENNDLDLFPDKTTDTTNMISHLIKLMEQQNSIAEKTAGALDKFGDAYKSMARSMEILLADRAEETQSKRKAS